jgi:hypothetical protein
MMWTLVRKELLANLLTLRLSVALVVSVVLCVLATVVGRLEFTQHVERYESVRMAADEGLAHARVYWQVRPVALFAPQALGIFCRGITHSSGYRMDFNLDSIPVGAAGRRLRALPPDAAGQWRCGPHRGGLGEARAAAGLGRSHCSGPPDVLSGCREHSGP